MADRILTWYVDQPEAGSVSQGQIFCLDQDYQLPAVVRFYAKSAPDAADLVLDIKDDGVSIFTNKPTLQKGQSGQDWWEDFDPSLHNMEKYSWVSLEFSQTGGAKGITVQLELLAEYPEDAGEEDEEDI